MHQAALWLCPVLLCQVQKHTILCVWAGEPSPNTLAAFVTAVKLCLHISMLYPHAHIVGHAMDLVLQIWDMKITFWLQLKWPLLHPIARAVFCFMPLLYVSLDQPGVTTHVSRVRRVTCSPKGKYKHLATVGRSPPAYANLLVALVLLGPRKPPAGGEHWTPQQG